MGMEQVIPYPNQRQITIQNGDQRYERYGQVVIINVYNVTYDGGTRSVRPNALRPAASCDVRYGIRATARHNAGIVYVDQSGSIKVWAGASGTYTGQVVYTV